MRYLPTLLSIPLFGIVLAAPSTSYRMDNFTFREQAAGVTVFASGFPASHTTNAAYVPVPVAIALMRNGRSVAFTTESFTLTDARGNRVPAAGYMEVIDGYPKWAFESSLMRTWPINVGMTVAEHFQIPANFYPPQTRRTQISRVELAPFSWFQDVIYFPRPPAGLGGVMTLSVAVSGAEPIDLKFLMSPDELAK